MPATFETADTSAFLAPPNSQAVAVTGLDISVEPRFLLFFDPARADVFLTTRTNGKGESEVVAEILPDLIQLPEIPGMQGIQEADGPNGLVIVSKRAQNFHSERGATIVPETLAKTAFGVSIPHYCQGHGTKNGRISWRLAWYSFRSLGSRVAKKFDADGYHDFLRRVKVHFLGKDDFDRSIVDDLRDRLMREARQLRQTPPDRRTGGQSANLEIYEAKLLAFAPKKPAAKAAEKAA